MEIPRYISLKAPYSICFGMMSLSLYIYTIIMIVIIIIVIIYVCMYVSAEKPRNMEKLESWKVPGANTTLSSFWGLL